MENMLFFKEIEKEKQQHCYITKLETTKRCWNS